MADIEEGTEIEQDETQQGSRPDPTETIARYLNPDKGNGGDDGGWGALFSRVANGPKIKPPVAPSPSQPSQNDPDATRSLGEFAAATGTTKPPTSTHLSQIAPPPNAPTMDPAFATTQADLRDKSAITPKIDPETGQTADKYKIGVGGRIGRALKDFGMGVASGHGLLGAAGDVARGAFGDKDSPDYFGKGAVNGQYFKDEKQRRQDVSADTARIKSFEDENTRARDEFKDKNDVYKDSLKQAYDQDLTDIKQQTQNERVAHDQETEGLKRQLQEATTPEAKLKAEINARTSIAKQLNLAGRDQQLYVANGKLPDDETISRRLQLEEERIGIDRTRAARETGADGGQWYTTPRELADYKSRTTSLDREASSLEGRKALYTEAGTSDSASTDALKRINDRLDAIDKQKETVKQGIISNRPSKRDSSPAAPQQDDGSITQPVADVRTGQPVSGIEAHTNDGAPATPVVTGKDAKGRPTIGIQPGAPAQPKLSPIPDKEYKTAGGKTYKIGDMLNGRAIKGFAKDETGKVRATF